MSACETAYAEVTLSRAKDVLASAIKTVLDADPLAARKAHQIHPHLRLKELNYVKNDNIGAVGFRRLSQIADGLGIEIEINVKLPSRLT